LLDLPAPSNSHASGYSFQYPVKITSGPGTVTDGFLDLYRRGALPGVESRNRNGCFFKGHCASSVNSKRAHEQ
jgi:hypothetical protein